jgi:acyl carrier protein
MFDKLTKILADQFGVTQDQIVPQAHIVNDLGADSVDIVEIIMHIEKAYRIAIEQHEYQDRVTVALLQELIDQKCKAH